MKKYLLTFVTVVLMVFSAYAEIDPDHRTAALGIMVLPKVEPSMYVLRYYVYFTPREGNIYYRCKNNLDGVWSEWSECGKVVTFSKPATYTLEAYAQREGKPESAHITTTFTVDYAGMSGAAGIILKPTPERGYYMTMNSVYNDDIYYRVSMDDGVWGKWRLYQGAEPFTEVGKYSIQALCDYENANVVSVTFEVDRSTRGFLGDVNMDGKVNVADVTSLVSFILGDIPKAFDEKVADVNGDSEINVADVTALIDMVLSGQ